MTNIKEEELKHVPLHTTTQYHNDKVFQNFTIYRKKVLKEFKIRTKD